MSGLPALDSQVEAGGDMEGVAGCSGTMTLTMCSPGYRALLHFRSGKYSEHPQILCSLRSSVFKSEVLGSRNMTACYLNKCISGSFYGWAAWASHGRWTGREILCPLQPAGVFAAVRIRLCTEELRARVTPGLAWTMVLSLSSEPVLVCEMGAAVCAALHYWGWEGAQVST